MLTDWNPAQATEAALEFIPPGGIVTLEDVVDGITLSRGAEVDMEFTHVDLKVRGKYTHLRIVKINDGVIVAHDVNDTNPWAPSIYYFGKGLREQDVTWIEQDEPAFVPQTVEADECMKEEWF